MRILALGAHPDDIEIFMFGTLAAFRARGDTVLPVIATDGARGGTGDPEALAARRRVEATSAAALLDAEPRFLGFADGSLLPEHALVSALRALVGEWAPDLAITHAPDDYHGDHRALSAAMQLAANFQVPVLFADTLGGVGPQPTHYVDVTAHMEEKIAAIRRHVSQDPERFVAAALQQNAFRASQCRQRDGAYAEAFRFQPVYPYADIRDLLPPAPPVRPIRGRIR